MHQLQYETYADSEVRTAKARKAIQTKWDKIAAKAGYMEGVTGLFRKIEWAKVTPFHSKEDALEYIHQRDQECNFSYLPIAVPYVTPKDSKKRDDIMEKLVEAKAALEDMNQVYYTSATVKSKLITCKHCGSKLAVAYMKQNQCPVCGSEMRPDTVLNKVKRLKEKIKKLEEKKEEVERKTFDKRWLLKVEYHV